VQEEMTLAIPLGNISYENRYEGTRRVSTFSSKIIPLLPLLSAGLGEILNEYCSSMTAAALESKGLAITSMARIDAVKTRFIAENNFRGSRTRSPNLSSTAPT
jgi:hypothetical protein